MINPHVESVEFPFQSCSHKFIHEDIFSIELQSTNLVLEKS